MTLALVLGWLAFAGPAIADPAKAREAYEQGITLIEQGDLRGARASFEEAYAERPHYVVLYNLARVCFDLNDLVAARAYLERYLADGAAQLTPDERTDANAFLRTIDDSLTTQAARRGPPEPASAAGTSPVAERATPTTAAPPRSESATAIQEGPPPPRAPGLGTTSTPPPGRAAYQATKSSPPPVDFGLRRKSFALGLGGAGVVVVAASLGVEIWNHTRYLDWRREATRLGQTPPPAEIRTDADLAALSAYQRAAGRADAKRSEIRATDVVAWVGTGVGMTLLGTAAALYVWAPHGSGDRALGATISGRF